MGITSRNSRGTVGKLLFAADNQGTVFVNGKKKGFVSHWRKVGRISIRLYKGDVISIKAADFGVWYGVIADLEYGGKHYGTGSNDWKAVKKFDLVGLKNKNAWMLPTYSTCNWPTAAVRPRENEYFPGKAKDFPHNLKAKYVWASDADEKDTVFMRLVVGGEKCGHFGTEPPTSTVESKTESVHSTDKTSSKGQEIKIEGQSDEDGTGVCRCKVSSSTSPGVCWEMLEAGGTRCFWRDCEARYECVPSDEDAPFMCIRRWISEKVVHIRGPGEEDHCKVVATTPTMFYSPYNE